MGLEPVKQLHWIYPGYGGDVHQFELVDEGLTSLVVIVYKFENDLLWIFSIDYPTSCGVCMDLAEEFAGKVVEN